jgi:hypothetical protein
VNFIFLAFYHYMRVSAVTKRRNSGTEFAEIPAEFFFKIRKIFRPGIFNQKLKSASSREFYSLYDAIRRFTKFGFLVS